MSETQNNVSDFVQKHFVSVTNVSQFAQPKKHHGQQCVLVYQGLKASAHFNDLFILMMIVHVDFETFITFIFYHFFIYIFFLFLSTKYMQSIIKKSWYVISCDFK